MVSWNGKAYRCPVEITIGIVGGKWKCLILWHLHQNTMRFKELERIVVGVSPKMLSQQLNEMECDGLLTKKIYAEVPPRVEYKLTDRGESLFPVLQQMHGWALEQLDVEES
ncbi:MAG: helix-turn-helix domain-containing protein [Pontiella sp.]